MFALRSLRKAYGGLVAVDGVDLEIRPGEAFGLLGPNGAGKTTTISLMVGSLKPDAGSVQVGAWGSPQDPRVRSRVGYSSQSLAIYRMLTAEENLRFFGTLYGLTGARLRERVGWALEFAGLTARAQDRAGTFSGGMQRRLNLACSLLHEPDVLIMDEPTVGVDPQSRNLIFERVEELKQRGLTLIYTTHYMEEAARLCDRIAIMDQGRVLALDTLEMLIARHGGTPRVCFDVATDSPMPPVPPGWTLLGQRLEAPAPNPVETVQQAVQAGWTILGFQTQRPSLEDVFLNLTGRCLRD